MVNLSLGYNICYVKNIEQFLVTLRKFKDTFSCRVEIVFEEKTLNVNEILKMLSLNEVIKYLYQLCTLYSY